MKRISILTGGFLLLAAWNARAAQLDPVTWKLTGPNAGTLKLAVDNNLDTAWESDGLQAEGTAILIDLGRSCEVYRVYLTPGREASKFPRSLRVSVGETPEALRLVASEDSLPKPDKVGSGWETPVLRGETDLRFAPAKGRFVKLAIGQNGAGLPWAIAEMEIHAARTVAPAKRMAVVLDRKFIVGRGDGRRAFNPLGLAAEDLQYYLMALTDTPVDIVASEEATNSQGLRFRLVTPPPEQVPNPEPDPKNLEDVSVTRVGDEISISGPTARAVLYGAYEFLRRQGVRWLYSDPHGDSVPALRKLDLSVLPIAYRPPFSTRGFIDPASVGETEEFSRFQARHGFNLGLERGMSLGTVPRMNCGFGWAHTMGALFEGQEKLHPDWWPGPYRKGWYKVPCTSDPEVARFIEQKIDTTYADHPRLQGFSVHPNDAPCFCECPRCEKLFGKPERKDPDGADEMCDTWDYSDYDFYLINTLAKSLKQTHPELFLKTLAYANHEQVPKLIPHLPDNVLVDVCPFWVPLPVDAPQNTRYRDTLKAWTTHCGSMGIWSYVLIYSDTTFGYPAGEKNLVVPNVRAIVDQNHFYHDLGYRSVTTQLMGPQIHWPWGLYAFARTTWQPDEKAETILHDFFRGYYGEAWEPMLRWYELLEKSALANNIDTRVPDPRLFDGGLIEQLRAALTEAKKKANVWYVKERVDLAQSDTEWTWMKSQWRTQADNPYPCYRLKTPPVIDGKLDDAVWQTVPELAGFHIVATRLDAAHPGRMAVDYPTRFRMGWDDRFLYVGVKCDDPGIAKTRETDAKETKFVYNNVVELFFAPDAPPYYRQTLVNSAGYIMGPLKIRQVNSDEVITNAGFACKTAYQPDGWTLEARFPLAMVAQATPKEGTCWPANVVRALPGDADGERFSAWSDLPRYHFHEYALGTWSVIQFHDTALTDAESARTTETLNAGYARIRQANDAQRERLPAFAQELQGKDNLSAGKNANLVNAGGPRGRCFELVWGKGPVTFDALWVVWANRRVIRPWYSLEYWDGERYRLIDERRDNDAEASVHEFAPVTGSRVRLTLWPDLNGWTDVPSVKAIEVFKR